MEQSTDRPGYEPEPSTSARDQPAAHRISELARLWAVFVSPGEVFADIRVKPTWVACLIAMVVLGVAVQLVVVPHVDTEATLRARLGDRAADLGDAQIEQMVKQGEKFAKFGPIVAVAVSPIAWAIMAAVFFVMLKIVGSEADFLRTFSTTLHAYWPPSLVLSVLTGVLIQRLGQIPQQELTNVVKSHVGAFLPQDAPGWLAGAASTISVFNIWTVVLLVIGLSLVGGVSRGRAAVAALVPWVVWLAGKAGMGALLS